MPFTLADLPYAYDALQPPTGRQAEATPQRAPTRVSAPVPAPRQEAAPPVAVDRYQSGNTTYLMFSDGSVEVRSPAGAQRFASLAELKAQVGERA
ncbi:MAG: hypothetical protein HYZ60_05470 [Methylocystis sp.]|nr:hypothetical protein [Methylocystis sp.]